mmetsp:Transcript_11163/g.25408  ORF Transcript_11163/g.25408 Transcript_11163/m.25408 type:complete len:114 (+) Transcript_11163:441-782(+)
MLNCPHYLVDVKFKNEAFDDFRPPCSLSHSPGIVRCDNLFFENEENYAGTKPPDDTRHRHLKKARDVLRYLRHATCEASHAKVAVENERIGWVYYSLIAKLMNDGFQCGSKKC